MEAVLPIGTWQLQEAKAKLSQVIKNAAREPQIITLRGEEAAVVLSPEKYRQMAQTGPGLYEFLQNSPLCDADIDFERDQRPWEDRDINL
jgi:prevent-host-death family protein